MSVAVPSASHSWPNENRSEPLRIVSRLRCIGLTSECRLEALHRNARISCLRGASQIGAAILLEIAQGLVRERIQPPCRNILLELLIPRLCIEMVKPFPERRKLIAGKLA